MQIITMIGAVVVLTSTALNADQLLTEGVNGMMSPDGTKVAFQRNIDQAVKLGLYYLADGRIEWVEDSEEWCCAAFPFWAKDGSLYYSYGNRTHTAYENFKGPYNDDYRIRRWKDGVVETNLVQHIPTHTKGFDVSPSVSPDGETLWYCSNVRHYWYGTKTMVEKWTYLVGNRICRVKLGEPASAGAVYEGAAFDGYSGHCFSQPVVSPCGRVLAWAQADSFAGGWSIRLGPVNAVSNNTTVSQSTMLVLAPNWAPDGTNLVFTGCGVNDSDGYYAYILNTRHQWQRKVCRGENATFTPDGKGLLYDLNNHLYLHTLTEDEWPTKADRILDEGYGYHPWAETIGWEDPETVLFSIEGEDLKTNVTFNTTYNFGTDTNVFVRVRAIWNGDKSKTQILTRFLGAANAGALQFYVHISGRPFFSTRLANYQEASAYQGMSGRPGYTLEAGKEYEFTGIRCIKKVLLSIDGCDPISGNVNNMKDGLMPLDDINGVQIFGDNCAEGTIIKKVELGIGWPNNVPRENYGYINGFDWKAVEE